jgi:molecular chaperone DnaK (HSP70)
VGHRILGIDLGTVNSCVAVVEDGRAIVLSEDGRRTIPSCLSLQRNKEIVGHAARRQAVTEPRSTVSAVKRILGHSFESAEVQAVMRRVAYPIRPSPVGSVLLEINGHDLTPVQISARILLRIREAAEKALDEVVRKAVISVPAHFTDVQRKATKLAAEYAGLEVVRLLNEPTAAAFAYGYRKGEDFRLAVYDLGGGTFDITVMTAQGDCFQVEATDGDSFLGGEDFDEAIVEWLMDAFQSENGHDLRGDQTAELRLKEAAEQAKIELSGVEETRIELPFLAQLSDGSRPLFTRTLTRQTLAEIARPLVQKTLDLCDRCLQAARIQRSDIDEVLMVGGQSRMPGVRDAVREFFGREPRRDINPDEVVAMGAALYGYSLAADDLKEEEETAAEEAYAVALKDTGVAKKLLDGVVKRLLQEATEPSSEPLGDDALALRIETLLAQTESLHEVGLDDLGLVVDAASDEDLPEAVEALRGELLDLKDKAEELIQQVSEEFPPGYEQIAANEAIDRAAQRITKCLDAAEQASQKAQDHLEKAKEHAQARKVTLIDVTSHALGIASAAEIFTVLIEKNVPIPTGKGRTFTTDQDDQTEVAIRVYEGSASRVSDNQFLGEFVLEGIAPAARMEPRVDVMFSIDENGILAVKARDARSGKEQGIRVEDPLHLRKTDPPKQDQELELEL